jgi:hypothetical protein
VTAVRGANLALAFALELCALGALAWWGWRAGAEGWSRWALALGLPAAAAVLWGLFAAPQATFHVPALTVATKVVVFGAATLALWAVGRPGLAVAFAALVVANAAVLAAVE